jgi:hypothetical protein
MFEVEFVLSSLRNTFTGLAYAYTMSPIGRSAMLSSAPLPSSRHCLPEGGETSLVEATSVHDSMIFAHVRHGANVCRPLAVMHEQPARTGTYASLVLCIVMARTVDPTTYTSHCTVLACPSST